jgi:hypothetical protein
MRWALPPLLHTFLWRCDYIQVHTDLFLTLSYFCIFVIYCRDVLYILPSSSRVCYVFAPQTVLDCSAVYPIGAIPSCEGSYEPMWCLMLIALAREQSYTLKMEAGHFTKTFARILCYPRTHLITVHVYVHTCAVILQYGVSSSAAAWKSQRNIDVDCRLVWGGFCARFQELLLLNYRCPWPCMLDSCGTGWRPVVATCEWTFVFPERHAILDVALLYLSACCQWNCCRKGQGNCRNLPLRLVLIPKSSVLKSELYRL